MGTVIEAVSSGSFPDLFQEIFQFKVRLIGTPGVHFKISHKKTYSLSAALCLEICEGLC